MVLQLDLEYLSLPILGSECPLSAVSRSSIPGTLGHVPSPDLAREAIFPTDGEEYRALKERFDGATEDAAREGFSLQFQVPRTNPRTGFCNENISCSLVVSTEGWSHPAC